ncbi:unnamed protein product [Malus baccata var. baccata]
MEVVLPPEFNIQPGPPLWVSLEEQGFYGFQPIVCALSYLNTHDILQCPKREYFSAYVQTHINTRRYSKRHWNNPCLESYNPKLKEHIEQYFEQFNVPQELSVEDLSKLLESTKLYIEITNEGFLIQALNYGKSLNDQEEIGAGTEEQSTTHSSPGEKTTHAEPIIPPEPSATQVHVPPQKTFPQSLQ